MARNPQANVRDLTRQILGNAQQPDPASTVRGLTQQILGREPDPVPAQPDPYLTALPATLGERYQAGLYAGVEGIRSMGAGFKAIAAQAMGADYDSVIDSLAEMQYHQANAGASLAGLENFSTIIEEPTLEGFINAAAVATGEVVPSLALSITAAVLGGPVGLAARMTAGVGRAATQQAASNLLKKAAAQGLQGLTPDERDAVKLMHDLGKRELTRAQAFGRGAAAGAMVPESVLGGGAAAGELYDPGNVGTDGRPSQGQALGAVGTGIVSGAIGVGGEALLVNRLWKAATGTVPKGKVLGLATGVAAGAARGGGQAAAVEGVTEAAQEGLQLSFREATDPGHFLREETEPWMRIGEAWFKGTVGSFAPGAALGGAAGVSRVAKNLLQGGQTDPNQPPPQETPDDIGGGPQQDPEPPEFIWAQAEEVLKPSAESGKQFVWVDQGSYEDLQATAPDMIDETAMAAMRAGNPVQIDTPVGRMAAVAVGEEGTPGFGIVLTKPQDLWEVEQGHPEDRRPYVDEAGPEAALKRFWATQHDDAALKALLGYSGDIESADTVIAALNERGVPIHEEGVEQGQVQELSQTLAKRYPGKEIVATDQFEARARRQDARDAFLSAQKPGEKLTRVTAYDVNGTRIAEEILTDPSEELIRKTAEGMAQKNPRADRTYGGIIDAKDLSITGEPRETGPTEEDVREIRVRAGNSEALAFLGNIARDGATEVGGESLAFPTAIRRLDAEIARLGEQMRKGGPQAPMAQQRLRTAQFERSRVVRERRDFVRERSARHLTPLLQPLVSTPEQSAALERREQTIRQQVQDEGMTPAAAEALDTIALRRRFDGAMQRGGVAELLDDADALQFGVQAWLQDQQPMGMDASQWAQMLSGTDLEAEVTDAPFTEADMATSLQQVEDDDPRTREEVEEAEGWERYGGGALGYNNAINEEVTRREDISPQPTRGTKTYPGWVVNDLFAGVPEDLRYHWDAMLARMAPEEARTFREHEDKIPESLVKALAGRGKSDINVDDGARYYLESRVEPDKREYLHLIREYVPSFMGQVEHDRLYRRMKSLILKRDARHAKDPNGRPYPAAGLTARYTNEQGEETMRPLTRLAVRYFANFGRRINANYDTHDSALDHTRRELTYLGLVRALSDLATDGVTFHVDGAREYRAWIEQPDGTRLQARGIFGVGQPGLEQARQYLWKQLENQKATPEMRDRVQWEWDEQGPQLTLELLRDIKTQYEAPGARVPQDLSLLLDATASTINGTQREYSLSDLLEVKFSRVPRSGPIGRARPAQRAREGTLPERLEGMLTRRMAAPAEIQSIERSLATAQRRYQEQQDNGLLSEEGDTLWQRRIANLEAELKVAEQVDPEEETGFADLRKALDQMDRVEREGTPKQKMGARAAVVDQVLYLLDQGGAGVVDMEQVMGVLSLARTGG
ncbi:MAG: hypothetical protein OXE50_16360, partial [Chloroflexi bacterium]|nr:hypothetical protein [Chloroflexota bacterium]